MILTILTMRIRPIRLAMAALGLVVVGLLGAMGVLSGPPVVPLALLGQGVAWAYRGKALAAALALALGMALAAVLAVPLWAAGMAIVAGGLMALGGLEGEA